MGEDTKISQPASILAYEMSVNARGQTHRSHRAQSDFAFPPLAKQRWFSEQAHGEE